MLSRLSLTPGARYGELQGLFFAPSPRPSRRSLIARAACDPGRGASVDEKLRPVALILEKGKPVRKTGTQSRGSGALPYGGDAADCLAAERTGNRESNRRTVDRFPKSCGRLANSEARLVSWNPGGCSTARKAALAAIRRRGVRRITSVFCRPSAARLATASPRLKGVATGAQGVAA